MMTVFPLFLGSCAPHQPTPTRNWQSFVNDLTNIDRLASLDTAGDHLISSFDPTGGNDDFNHFKAPGRERGWVVLADLKGPGCVRRFWTTGEDPGHPFRFYFDGERKPRLSGEIDEVFGGRYPFTPPLAQYMNLCWCSYVPLAFWKSLRIETKEPNTHPFWGQRRIFYHINYETYGSNECPQSYPVELSAGDRAAVEAVRARWLKSVEWPAIDFGTTAPISLAPGQSWTLLQTNGPATVLSFAIDAEPAGGTNWTQQQKEYLLQDTVLSVSYDGMTTPSISVPLGDFFGNAWRKRNYGSLLLGSTTNGYACRMPMPFRKSIRIDVMNGADKPVNVRFAAAVNPGDVQGSGYLHAQWLRSGPESGTPHTIADFRGRGKFVGFFLGVTGVDDSWWVLEGDEMMFVDGERVPQWHGTGLEDYFNGGWYYRGVAFNALNGIMDRAPFRVAQYRHQLVDPVAFDKSIHVEIERGDQNVSHAYFQSVAYAYLAAPTAVLPCTLDRNRRAVEDPNFQRTLMVQLIELERMNNFGKAADLAAEYVEHFPKSEAAGVLQFRILEYRRLLGGNITDADYRPFLEGKYGAEAVSQAKLLKWFYEEPNRVLVGLNVNGGGRLFCDGKEILSGDHPMRLFVTGMELNLGPHTLSAEVEWHRQDAWYQVGLRTHDGVTGSGPGTFGSLKPPTNWQLCAIDPKQWQKLGLPDIPRGVPDAPYIGSMPNAFVLLQSKTYPLSAPDWGYYHGNAYFRTDFSLPLAGWPAFARQVTGLER